jgi:hypothetical protein
VLLLAGAIVIVGRNTLEGNGKDGDKTMMRSWLAISLVGGLLLFVALSFLLDDVTLRSTLVGGLVANAGAAVAFYFASKASDQARKDILTASLPSVQVPDITAKRLDEVRKIVAATPFLLAVAPDSPAPGAEVIGQIPPATQLAPPASTITATFAGPVPDLTGMTVTAATDALAKVQLKLAATPSRPNSSWTVTSQDVKAADPVPANAVVPATFKDPNA